MGDSVSWGYEQQELRREKRAREKATERKRRVTGYDIEVAIKGVLDVLKDQQLSRKAWEQVDRLERVWFGKQGR